MGSQRPHVLIIGAGLSGLTLAQSLRKQGITFEIFERDHDQYSRFQGWAISMHKTIEPVLEAMPDDLADIETVSHFYPHTYQTSMGLWDATTGKNIMMMESAPGNRMIRANRSRLRTWLSTNIPIQWSKNLTSYKISADGKEVTASFADGTSAKGNMIVAADGVHSHVRAHLVGGRAHDRLQVIPLGMIVAELTVDKAVFEKLFELGHSASVAFNGTKGRIFIGLKGLAEDEQSAIYYWLFSWPDAAAADEASFWTASASAEQLLEYALEHSRDFQPQFREIMTLTKPADVHLPPLIVRELVPEPTPEGSRVVLLGDAAHSMSMFQGEGGNHAMLDACKLGGLLANATVDSVPQAIKDYEAEMVERTTEAVERSRRAAVSGDKKDAMWSKMRAHIVINDP